MNLTVIHTGQKVTVNMNKFDKAVVALGRYLDTVRVDRKHQVRDALYELRHGRTVSTEAAGINERVDPSLMTCTYYSKEGW
jgi:hypothetical protein